MKKPDHAPHHNRFPLRLFVLAMIAALTAAFLLIWVWFYIQLIKIGRAFILI